MAFATALLADFAGLAVVADLFDDGFVVGDAAAFLAVVAAVAGALTVRRAGAFFAGAAFLAAGLTVACLASAAFFATAAGAAVLVTFAGVACLLVAMLPLTRKSFTRRDDEAAAA